MSIADRLYARAPIALQHTIVSGYGAYWYWLRFGPGYAAAVAAYRRRDRYSTDEWMHWQQQQLKALLRYACGSIPFYRDHWSMDQQAAALAGRVQDLPLLEKDAIRQSPDAFVRSGAKPRRGLTFHTSGSTGTPIATVWTPAEIRDSLAVREVRSAGWAGVSFKLPRATFSGRMVEPDPASSGPFYRYNAVERQVYLSAFHLRPETAAQYVAALERHRVQWLTGYAVSYYLLAKHILDQRLKVPPLKAIITTSEKVTPEMRRVMEQAFRCRVYEEYSSVENALFASECEHGRLHSSPDVAVVEILHPDGSACGPGEVGEVVTTCLMRTLQPFIRYRLGDLAMWDAAPCPCGRSMPVISEVIGRIEDVIVGPDGRELVRFHGIFTDQPHVIEGQIIQETLNQLRVRVVAADGFNPDDTLNIIARVQQRIGSQIDVIVEPVAHIERTKLGKFKAVVSLISENT